MQIRIHRDLFNAVGEKKWEPWGISSYRYSHSKFQEIDLSKYSLKKTEQLLEMIKPHEKLRFVSRVIQDINTFIGILTSDATSLRPRTAQHFFTLFKKAALDFPGQRLYKKDVERDIWFVYYINNVVYHPPRKMHGGGYTEAYTEIHLCYESFSTLHTTSWTVYQTRLAGRDLTEIMSAYGYYSETEELRKTYLDEIKLYKKYLGSIGKQFLGRGIATDNLDGNKTRDEDRWYRRTQTIQLDKNDEPSHLVIDVFQETEKGTNHSSRDKHSDIDTLFWIKEMQAGETDGDENHEFDIEEDPDIEIPIHPFMACFDLRRHLRVRVHMSQLTEYKYNPKLGDNLVLPDDSRQLINVLLSYTGGFKDIIATKGGGSVILSVGDPGTGKTLTAEVYAEIIEKPLYSVQCSQLGLTADDLEESLLQIFARAQRWGAILLLDEADVYIRHRGDDIEQNAIVGVFLRTLEYYKGVLFLTTNRGDSVDDAISSRCIAKIEYRMPLEDEQVNIWRILARVMGLSISDQTIKNIVYEHPKINQCSGRDIKNLLKLASLISKNITKENIQFVSKFKPTKGYQNLAGLDK